MMFKFWAAFIFVMGILPAAFFVFLGWLIEVLTR